MGLVTTLSQTIKLHRLIRLRRRYYLTRSNRVRLRYVVGSVAIFSLSLSTLMGAMNASIAFSPADSDVLAKIQGQNDQLASMAYNPELQATFDGYADEMNAKGLMPNDFEDAPAESLNAIEPAAGTDPAQKIPMGPQERVVYIGNGETIVGALQGVGVKDSDAYSIVKAMSEHVDMRGVKAGQPIAVSMEPADGAMTFSKLSMKIDPTKEVVVSKLAENSFEANLHEKKVLVKPNAVKALIKTSLYGSAARAGIPASIVAELIRIYSYEVDFQRDIREGDKLEVLFETYETEDGDFAHYGNVLYANLMVEGRSIPLYRYEPKDGRADYYTQDGLSVRKTLMKTPIDGARITSGFGMRRHPILGYNKMHKGMDFAASVGTPIYAAGDGVVDYAGRKGAYGNYVSIKHNGSLKSAYAHMMSFAKGLRSGQKVEQGQIIGYVGTTGRSTGPHLHFEVIKSGQQINPANLKLTGQKLAGKDYDRFRNQISHVRQQYVSMTQGMKFAQNGNSE